MGIQTAYSQAETVPEAVAELQKQLGQPRLLIFFAASHYAPAELAPCLQTAFPESTVMGCTTAGELISGQMLNRSIVAMGFAPDKIADLALAVVPRLSAGVTVDPACQAFETHFGRPLAALDYREYVGLVLCDGLSMAEESLLEQLGDRSQLIFVGASAGDDLAFQQTHVFADGQACSDAAVIAIFKPSDGFELLKTQSFSVLPKELTPTAVDSASRTVLAFDGQPALAAYARQLGVSEAEAPALFMRHPLGLMDGDEPFVRSPMQATDQGLRFYCAVRPDMPLSLLQQQDIVSDTRRILHEKIAQMGGVSAVINFHCILRTLQLQSEDQIQAYGEIFAEVPTIGFSTYGEAFITHINQTSTLLLLK